MREDLDIATFKKRLEEERRQLLERVSEPLGDGRDLGPRKNPDRTDMAQAYMAREQDAAIDDIEQRLMAQIDAALERIENGTYGICTNCGEPIKKERLEALPYASLCIDCQSDA